MKENFINHCNSNTLYPLNMFITKKKFFIEYCKKVFPWMEKCFEYCKNENLLNDYNIRLPSFLSERFVSFWFSKFKNKKCLSYARLGSFFLSNYSYLKRGNYYQQIIDFKNIFPKSKFLFLKYEDFKNIKKQKKFINMIYDFLNLKTKNNLNLSFHENKYGAMRFDFIRDLTHTNNKTRRFFKKLIPSEYLRFKIITLINNLNKIDSDKEKLDYKLLKNKYIKWNNEQTDLISKICDLDINDWKI
ncbi:MAG: hypothetical protein CMG39_00765 [Candidatus Marinimicrobia bacterium]|nr:hypothetical protein [Candidatus Neomarinimicrobiota bacterium]